MRRALLLLQAILFFGMTTSVCAAAEGDLDALLRRLADVEAEQAKNRATIEALRSELEALGRKAEDDRRAEQPAKKPAKKARAVVTDVPADAGAQASLPPNPGPQHRTMFPELADEARFVLRTDDGDFSLGLDGLIVGRYE